MLPFYFGSPSRRLFGMFHEGSIGRAQNLAVLLCNPFGQEAIRTQRLYRVLAGRLAQAGVHTLRFDYYGTGDSAGDDAEGEMDGWRQDVWAAHQELSRLSGAETITWMGARLGAATAVLACAGSGSAEPRLVLWDPVVNGAAYAQLLRTKHVETLETSYSVPDRAWRHRLENDIDSFRDEAIGVAVSPALRGQLALLVGERLRLPANRETVVIFDPADLSVSAWLSEQRTRGARIDACALKQALEWTSDDSLNAALVPAEAIQALLLAIDR